MLRIGTLSEKYAEKQALLTQQLLGEAQEAVEIILIKNSSLSDALLRGEVDVVPSALSTLPLEQPAGLVITALSARSDPADRLLVRPDMFDSSQIFYLKNGSTVGCVSQWQQIQLADFRPDVVFSAPGKEIGKQLTDLQTGETAATLSAAFELEQTDFNFSAYSMVPLHPREFVPAPAQGILAWLTHRDDLPTRRILKKIHHPEVSACSNVERKTAQLLMQQGISLFGVYCERDRAGNYHAFAACSVAGRRMLRARLSQSTNYQLADRLVNELKAQ